LLQITIKKLHTQDGIGTNRIVLYFFKTRVYYLSMPNKTSKHPTKRKCLHCEKSHSRIRAVYCSRKCSQKQHTKRNQESFKMDFQDGHRHEVSGGVDDFAMTTHSVPHNVLQEAKNYYDHTNSLYYEGEKIVEDVEKIMTMTNKILKETLTEASQVIKKRRLARRLKLVKKDEWLLYPVSQWRNFNKSV